MGIGRKAFVVANIKLDELDLTDASSQDVQAELDYLRNELRVMADRLAKAENTKQLPDLTTRDENIYVFEDEDEVGAAFDEFFSTPDPHLEKTRQFLLE